MSTKQPLSASNDNTSASVGLDEFYSIYLPLSFDWLSVKFTRSLMEEFVINCPENNGTETSSERIYDIDNAAYNSYNGDFWTFGWTRYKTDRFDEIGKVLGFDFRRFKGTPQEDKAVIAAERRLSKLRNFMSEANFDRDDWFPGEHIDLEAGFFEDEIFGKDTEVLVIGLRGEVSHLAARLFYTFKAQKKG